MAGQGHKSYIQFGPQADYDTAVTPTQRIEMVNEDIQLVRAEIPDPSLYDGRSRRGRYDGGYFFRGPCTYRMNYEGVEELIRAAFGLEGYDGTTVPEAGVRDHIFREGSTLVPLTKEIKKGAVPDATHGRRIIGGVPSSISIRGTAGTGAEAMLQLETNVTAKDAEGNHLLTTAGMAFPSVLPVTMRQATTVDNGTAETGVVLKSFDFTVTNPLDEGRWGAGFANIREPIPSEFLEAEFRMTQEFATEDLFDAAKAYTTSSPRLVFDGGLIPTKTSHYELEIKMDSSKPGEYSDPIPGFGTIIANVTWRGFLDSVDNTAMYIRLRNTAAALVAPV